MRLNRLDLNQLQVLDALLTERSATRVAARMGLTQPAVSAALRRLRAYFGDELFVPDGRRMIPTAFAETLLTPVRDLLLQGELISRMRPEMSISNLQRTLRVGMSDYAATLLLTPVLREAEAAAPNLRFDLFSVLDSRGTYHEDLDRGDVDLLILPEVYASPDHPGVEVLRDPYVCVGDAGNDALGEGFDEAAYGAMGHVTLSRRPNVAPVFDELHLAKAGVSRRIEASTPSFLMIPRMLLGTRRVATIPEGLARHFLERWPLRAAPCPVPMPPMVEVMQWRQHSERDAAVSWLRRRILETAGGISAAG